MLFSHAPLKFRTGRSPSAPKALGNILCRSLRSQVLYNVRHASVYTAKLPTFSGVEARLVTHSPLSSSGKVPSKTLCEGRCRELARADPSILVAPTPITFSRMLPRHSLWIVAREGYFKSPELQKKLEELDLFVEQKYAIGNLMLQTCYVFTLTARLASKWNKVKSMLVQGCDFLTTGEAHAASLDVRLTASEVALSIGIQKLCLEFLKPEDLDVVDCNALNTFMTNPCSVASLSCQGVSCVLLPGLKTGYLSSVSRSPLSPDFPMYGTLREHWEKQYSIILPEKENLFYTVGFGRKLTSCYTYPGSCVYKTQPTAVPVEDSCETRLAGMFIDDVHACMPTVCGETVRYEKTDSANLFTFQSRKESYKANENYSLYFPFDGESSNTSVPVNLSTAEGKRAPTLQESTHFPDPAGSHKVDSAEGRFYHVNIKGTLSDLPSVTTILKKTMPRESFFRLLSWKKGMTKEHGKKGFNIIAAKTMRMGSTFHKQLENYLRKLMISTGHKEDTTPTDGIKPELRESLSGFGYLESVQHVVEDLSEVYALENALAHPNLGYAGTVDCIAKYKDKLCVIDWKTSSTPRPSLSDLYDFPLQAAAYAGAINQDPYYPFKVHNILIVVVYKSGAPADSHFLSHQQCLHYWQQWLARLNHYYSTESSGLSVNLT